MVLNYKRREKESKIGFRKINYRHIIYEWELKLYTIGRSELKIPKDLVDR